MGVPIYQARTFYCDTTKDFILYGGEGYHFSIKFAGEVTIEEIEEKIITSISRVFTNNSCGFKFKYHPNLRKIEIRVIRGHEIHFGALGPIIGICDVFMSNGETIYVDWPRIEN